MRSGRQATEHELDIGHHELGPRLDEGVQPARHHGAGAGAEQIGADHAPRHAVEPHLVVERTRIGTGEIELRRQMILQVFADRQIGRDRDAVLAQMRGRADARQHQHLRRAEGAGREDHLALGRDLVALPVLDEFDAGRARTAQQHAGRLRARLDREVAAIARGLEERIGGRRAPAVPDGVLALAETFRARAVVIGCLGNAGRHAGVDPGLIERVARLRPLRAERARAAAIFVLAALPGLAPFEIGQHVRIGPAARALLGPAVIIAAVAARIGHHVDRRGAAQHLAARRLDPAVVQVGLRLGVEAPIMQAEIVHLAHADRDMDERIEVASPRLDQQHARLPVLAQPVGQHAAGRAGAHDDVVITAATHA